MTYSYSKEKIMEYLTKETFKEKVFDYEAEKDWNFKGDIPAIIDFYADWCGPCKMVSPILEDLSKEYDGKLKIYKINTENEQELAAAFGISSIPSMLFIPMNEKPQMSAGAMAKSAFKNVIKDVLKVH